MTKILLIEDDVMLRNEVAELLGYEGYEVSTAENGIAGVECACRELPDLIISDITMPQLDGYGVLLELRANLTTAHIPFILMSARASHEDVRQGIVFGADDYITKPFTRVELLQAIQVRLERKAGQERAFEHQIGQLRTALTQEHNQRLLKAKLVAMFSHDFRNQIAVIQSSNSLLRDYGDRLDEKRRLAHRNGIAAAAQTLMQMLDDMLIVAEIETGHFTLEKKPLSIETFIGDIVAEFQIVDGGKHDLQFDSGFHHNITMDGRLLRQITANLISNALKYSPPGSEVRVSLDEQEKQCVLMVQDQGIGISESDQLRLFDAFQRGNNVGDISGTGLGLAIIKQAADLLQCQIRLESQIDAGTKVMIAIPYVPAGDT